MSCNGVGADLRSGSLVSVAVPESGASVSPGDGASLSQHEGVLYWGVSVYQAYEDPYGGSVLGSGWLSPGNTEVLALL